MEYIHVKNLKRYQPKYKDGRNLIWIRWDVECLNDYTFSQLSTSEKWLFIGLICLETRLSGKMPCDFNFVAIRIGYPIEQMSSGINKLQELGLIHVTNCDILSHNVTNITEQNITEHNIKTPKVINKQKDQPTAVLLTTIKRLKTDLGINAHMLINRFKKEQSERGALYEIPESVYIDTCQAMLDSKTEPKSVYPYFMRILRSKSDDYFANKTQEEHKKLKNQKSAVSVADILKGQK